MTRTKTETSTPRVYDESYGYATIEEMLQVSTKFNQAYSAALHKELINSGHYESVDGGEFNNGDSGDQQAVKRESIDHDVIGEEDITATCDGDPQESHDHDGYK